MINVSSNAAPMSASLTLARTSQNLKQSITRLSSGLRINSSFDDPAGVAVSARFNNKVLKSSALGQNLGNTLSFLETQEAYLQRVGGILTRIQEIEIQKQDIIKNQGDISIYDAEKASLIAEIYQIRDEKFNGVRLFSPDSDMDSMNADTHAINNASEVVKQPPLAWKGTPDPVEFIFVIDDSGSMGGEITKVKDNIDAFLQGLVNDGKVTTWKAKAVSFNSKSNTNYAYTDRPWVTDTTNLISQLNNILSYVASGQGGWGGGGECLIDAVHLAVTGNNWTTPSSSKKIMVALTDELSDPAKISGISPTTVANNIVNNGITFRLFSNTANNSVGDSQANSLINQIPGASPALSLAAATTNNQAMTNALAGIADDVFSEGLIDFDTLTQYIAVNAAKQNRIRNLIDSNALLKNHATESLGEIRDLDIAAESINFNRLMLLQDAGTAYIAQSNVAMNHSLFTLLL
jgi:flagellin